MTNLYNITTQYRQLFDEMAEKEVWDDADLSTIGALDDAFENKAIAVAAYIKELESQEKAIDQACAEMSTRQLKLKIKVTNLRDYLYGSMIACKKEKIHSPLFDIKLKNNPPSVVVHDEKQLPRGYLTRKETFTVNKTLIKYDIDNGIEVPGARIVNKQRLEIK